MNNSSYRRATIGLVEAYSSTYCWLLLQQIYGFGLFMYACLYLAPTHAHKLTTGTNSLVREFLATAVLNG